MCRARVRPGSGHASDSIYFQISVFATAKLLGCFKRGQCVFGKIS